MFSPWAWNTGDEYYWSFQTVSYSGHEGYKFPLLDGDFWLSPDSRVVFLDYWFSRETYYYGFTYEWIRIFILQSLTILSSVWILFRKWQGTGLMLIPFFLSVYSGLSGLLLVARYMFVQTTTVAVLRGGSHVRCFQVFSFCSYSSLDMVLEGRKIEIELLSPKPRALDGLN